MRHSFKFALIFVMACSLGVTGCRRSGPVQTPEVVALPSQTLPLNPNDPAWNTSSEHTAKLVPQDLVEPRVLKTTTQEIHVRALTDGTNLALRLEWIDPTPDTALKPAHFIDGCAVQVPTKIEANVPAPQMGEAGKPVEITFWRADWQESVNGRPDTITALYPNAKPDHYPAEAPSLEKGGPAQKEMALRYAPAAAVGNRRVGPRETPVEDLIAEGPGTLSPTGPKGSRGLGVRTEKGWSVVIVRKLPNGLAPKVRSQIAFAIWEGSSQEVGARKMRTGWIPLMLKEVI